MGYQSLKALIAMQVMDLDDEMDVKDKLGGEKAAKLADKIYSMAFHLKASELLVFFWRFKCGMYGKFYGVVDSLKIMESLHEFIKWRNEKLAAIERKAKRERELTDPNEIAVSQWVKDWHRKLKAEVEEARKAREEAEIQEDKL